MATPSVDVFLLTLTEKYSLEAMFPDLRSQRWTAESCITNRYNCAAWAAGDSRRCHHHTEYAAPTEPDDLATVTAEETEMNLMEYDPPLDPGIAHAVMMLRQAGIETFESCEGGSGHAYPEPTVRFYGGQGEGMRALGAALEIGLQVAELRRVWPVLDAEPTGPWWELTFTTTGAAGLHR